MRRLALPLERKARGVDDIIEQPGRDSGGRLDAGPIELGVCRERAVHKLGKIDRAQIAGPVGRQRDLAARIVGADLLEVAEVVPGIHAIDKDHPRLGVVICRAHDAVPQPARRNATIDPAGARPAFARPDAFQRLGAGRRFVAT